MVLPEPLGTTEFGGSEQEMRLVASYRKAVHEIRQIKPQKFHRDGVDPEEDRPSMAEHGKGSRKQGKEGRRGGGAASSES